MYLSLKKWICKGLPPDILFSLLSISWADMKSASTIFSDDKLAAIPTAWHFGTVVTCEARLFYNKMKRIFKWNSHVRIGRNCRAFTFVFISCFDILITNFSSYFQSNTAQLFFFFQFFLYVFFRRRISYKLQLSYQLISIVGAVIKTRSYLE